ncbi:MAG: hypothetical protein HY648_00190 [Acidobacteria bacterium]|nr:hypothetical protein [Acidobacteriota bacterium]
MKKNLRAFGVLLAASLWASLCLAQTGAKGSPRDVPAGGDQPSIVSSTNVDLRALKSQLDAFQELLNRSMQQTFEMPFYLLQDAKGIYLPGFGVAFHLEVNLHPLRPMTPFDIRPNTPEEIRKAKDAKLERIRQLKIQLSGLLLEHGGSLSAMAPEQNIAIVVHLFNLPSESRDLPTQLVMMTNRRMLLDYSARRLTAEEFQKGESVLEF